MAEKGTAEEEVVKPKKKKGGIASIFILGLACAMPAISCLILVGLIPTLVMFMVERRRPRYVTYCVGVFNFSGTLPYVLTLLTTRMSLNHVGEILRTPTPWLVMYGSASLGLAIYSIIPNIIKIFRIGQIRSQLSFAEKQKEKILTQWGDKIKEKQQY